MAAIFDVGLKCASPKTILEMMTNTKELTPVRACVGSLSHDGLKGEKRV